LAGFNHVANNGTFLKVLCLLGGQFHQRVFDFRDNVPDGADRNLAIGRIHLDDYVLALGSGIVFVRGRERSLHGLHHNRLGEISLSGELGNR
jgi:hypothetical protein